MIKVGIVVPTYKEELFSKFITNWCWNSDTYDITLYVVEDNPRKSLLDVPEGLDENHRKHYSWYHIDKDLGKDSWIISRRSSAIRSYGYLKAYQDGMDYVLTLDDDCYPDKDMKSIEELITKHISVIDGEADYSNTWPVGGTLFGLPIWMRGSPIRYRKPRSPVVSIGGWSNNPDLDAWTQLERQAPKLECRDVAINVPKYLGLTMCGMNVMFKRETIPIAYFLLQGERWGVDRVDDIWAGLFMKKVLDHFDLPMAINGYASVYHDRASDAMASLKKEGISLQETELLWDRLSSINIKGDSLHDAYIDMIERCDTKWFDCVPGYGKKLLEAMMTWVSLFD